MQLSPSRRFPNPIRSEESAFRFVVLTLAFFAAVVLASVLLGPWAGLAAFIALSAAAVWWIVASRGTT
ncbi:MAG TPA: hypothetical protein VFU10_05865 [Gaiellaceae bacterium]|nr:hypothetical protein [Gaiellaceae bacterium]